MPRHYNKWQLMKMKQNKFKQYGWYWLSRLFSRGIPLIGIGFIYGLFEENTASSVQIEGMMTLGFAITLLFFYKDLKEKVSKAVEGFWTDAVDEAKWLVIVVLLLAFVQWAKTGLGGIEALLVVIAGAQTLALYPSIKHREYVRMNTKEIENKKEAI